MHDFFAMVVTLAKHFKDRPEVLLGLIVVLGGIFGAMDITGEKLTDQVYLCYGGGSAGAGIAAATGQRESGG